MSLRADNPVSSIRATLQAVEAQLATPGLPRDAVEDVKLAVDDLRLRVWANLTASSAADPEGVLLRFRLRRAIDICHQVDQDLDNYPLGANQRELLELLAYTRHLVQRITDVARGYDVTISAGKPADRVARSSRSDRRGEPRP
jgi:hypothetical protein